jgi:branched-chain amino acid transport system permease protein
MDIPGCRTVAPDLPNFGRSGALPGEIDLDRYADVLALFIEAVGLDRPIVVAHSLGGAVAQSLAARRPETMRALVLVDSAAPSGLKTPEERYPLIETMRTNPQVLSAALKAVVPSLKDEALFAALAEDASLMAAPAWEGNARALARFSCSGRLGAFGKPVLVVWGRKDVIVTEAMARETVAAFPNARLEILEDVGHSPPVEAPALFSAILSRFIGSVPAVTA